MYEIFPRFSRKPIFSHSSGVFAFTLLAIVGFSSWAHHMYASGMSFTEKTVFMVGTLAAVPASAMHTFNFLATMWGGRIKFATPIMWAVGGIALFFSAGAGGVVNAAMPLDFMSHDTYWVVGHFHLFVMGTILFGTVGFVYYMFPYVTGRMYNEAMGKIHFILIIHWNCLSILYPTHLGTIWNAKKNLRLSCNPRMGANEHHNFNWRIYHRCWHGNFPCET